MGSQLFIQQEDLINVLKNQNFLSENLLEIPFMVLDENVTESGHDFLVGFTVHHKFANGSELNFVISFMLHHTHVNDSLNMKFERFDNVKLFEVELSGLSHTVADMNVEQMEDFIMNNAILPLNLQHFALSNLYDMIAKDLF